MYEQGSNFTVSATTEYIQEYDSDGVVITTRLIDGYDDTSSIDTDFRHVFVSSDSPDNISKETAQSLNQNLVDSYINPQFAPFLEENSIRQTSRSDNQVIQKRLKFKPIEFARKNENLFIKYGTNYISPAVFIIEVSTMLTLGLQDWKYFIIIFYSMLLHGLIMFERK